MFSEEEKVWKRNGKPSIRLPACLKLQFEVPLEVKFNYFYFLNCTFHSALEILQKTAHLFGAENWQSARFCLVRFPLLMLNCSNSGIRSGLIKAFDCTFANLPLIIQWRYPHEHASIIRQLCCLHRARMNSCRSQLKTVFRVVENRFQCASRKVCFARYEFQVAEIR